MPPVGDVTRPITDRVKQSLFDILSPDLPGSRIYDCFAGTGSMGLECLSRGAAHVRFFEADKPALIRLKQNIETLKVSASSSVVAQDLFEWFNRTPIQPENERIDFTFLDPPYRFLKERPDDLGRLAMMLVERHLGADGTIIFRHDTADALELPQLRKVDQREYGGMTLEFLQPG